MALPITAASSTGTLFFVAFFVSPGMPSRSLSSSYCGHAAWMCRIPALHASQCDLTSSGRICSSKNTYRVSAAIHNR